MRTQDLPIDSGEVVSGNRHVIQDRLKRPEAWWAEENIQSMLNLRFLRANGEWRCYLILSLGSDHTHPAKHYRVQNVFLLLNNLFLKAIHDPEEDKAHDAHQTDAIPERVGPIAIVDPSTNNRSGNMCCGKAHIVETHVAAAIALVGA